MESFNFAPPFNYDSAQQFVHENSIKDDFLEALELQIRKGDIGYFQSFLKSHVDEIRIELKKSSIGKHQAMLMYLSRLYELVPMWWSEDGMKQLESFNNVMDEMNRKLKRKALQIVEFGLVNQSAPEYHQLPLKIVDKVQEDIRMEKRLEKPIQKISNIKLEPNSPSIFTMEDISISLETDSNTSNLSLFIRGENNYEKKVSFLLQETSFFSNKKLWNCSFNIENEGKFEISIEHQGKVVFKDEKMVNHRKISLSHGMNMSDWNRKCNSGDECTVIIPCVNSLNSNLVKKFNVEEIKSSVKCNYRDVDCKLSCRDSNLIVQFVIPFLGNGLLNMVFEDQTLNIPFIVEYPQVNWSNSHIIKSENIEIQDSRWIISEKSSIGLEIKICDMKDKPIELFDVSAVKARIETQSGSILDCSLVYIAERSSIKISFIAPSDIGMSHLAILNSNLSPLQKHSIEIIKERTFQIAIVDQKDGIGHNVKDKLKEKAMKQSVNLNIQTLKEIQRPDVVLRFIYHNGPPTWSDFKSIILEESSQYKDASVIMILATLNKEYWKCDVPDDSFPSGVNLYHSEEAKRERGVIWMKFDIDHSVEARENDIEFDHLVNLIKKVL